MKTVLYSLLIYAVLGGFIVAFCGCAPATQRNAAYPAELLACVDANATREGYEACRCEVQRRYGRDCR